MDTWDAIRSRRNIRSYREDPVPVEALDQVLEAGRRSPSSSNQQRWDFVVVTDDERLGRLADVWRGAGHVGRAAAAIGLVAPATADLDTAKSVHYDLGQATMSMMVMATDLGVATAHARVEDQELARELLQFPGDRECAWLIALGLPESPLDPIADPDRRSFDEVVHRESW